MRIFGFTDLAILNGVVVLITKTVVLVSLTLPVIGFPFHIYKSVFSFGKNASGLSVFIYHVVFGFPSSSSEFFGFFVVTCVSNCCACGLDFASFVFCYT